VREAIRRTALVLAECSSCRPSGESTIAVRVGWFRPLQRSPCKSGPRIPSAGSIPTRRYITGVAGLTNRGALFSDILDFCARVLAIQFGRARSIDERFRIPETVLGPLVMGRARSGSLGDRVEAHEFAIAAAVSSRGHAAALRDGHVSQDTDRLASTRARREAAARDISSAGPASPVPRYISSGVCPRNAECGSTWLCSWT